MNQTAQKFTDPCYCLAFYIHIYPSWHIHEDSCRLKNQHRNQCQGVRGKSEWCNDLKDAILSTPVENPSFGANLAMCQKTWSIHGCSSDHSLKFSIASDPYPYYNMFPGPPPDPPGHRPQLGIPSALGDRPPPSPHHHRRQWPGWVCSCWNPCPTGRWNVARLWLERCPPKEDTKRKFRLSDVVMIWYSGKLLVNYIAMFLLVLYTIMTPVYKFHIQSYKM